MATRLTFNPVNKINRTARLNLHRYRHTRGATVGNDVAEVLEQSFDNLQVDQEYVHNGTGFKVLQKDNESIEVLVYAELSLLAYNLISTAEDSRLKLVQGKIEVDEYEPSDTDIFRNSA